MDLENGTEGNREFTPPGAAGGESPDGRPGGPGRFAGLKWRILVWTSLVALVPLVIMAVQGYHCARQAVIESQENHLRSVVESAEVRVESHLEERKLNLAFLARVLADRVAAEGWTPEVLTGIEIDGNLLLGAGGPPDSLPPSLSVYDLEWTRPGGIPAPAPDRDHLDPKYVSQLETATGPRTGPVHVHEDGTIHYHVGTPIRTEPGVTAGYLVADFDLLPIMASLFEDRIGLGKTGKFYLTERDGRFLGGSFGARPFEKEEEFIPPPTALDGTGDVHQYEDALGTPVLGASILIPETGMLMVAEIDEVEAFGWLRVLQLRALATGSITLVLVLLVTLKISGKLSEPLQKLAAISRRVAAGHHEERLGALRGVEAREVARGFNKMLDELEASHRKLVQSASLAAVGRLSASIVHEMRNPLSTVKMNLQAVRRAVGDDPVHAELAGIALGQVSRLERMATDLLGYGKPLELHTSPVRFRELAEGVLPLVEAEAAEKRITLEIEDGLGDSAFPADTEHLQQALVNLVLNAVQASPPGEKVTVTAVPEDGGISLSVGDRGPGLPEGDADRVFEPFFTTREGGTGLGLPNVRKIVELHGGHVSAGNRDGGGAEFTVFLPKGGHPR